MTKNKWKISGTIIGSVFIILLLLFVFWGKQDVNLENTGIEEVPQGQDQSVSSGVTIEGAKDKVREPGIYRRGPLRFIKGEYVRIEGEFVPWKALEKQGVVIVKQGELSTPETGEEEEPEDYESVRNIDGIVILPDNIRSIAGGTFAYCNITEIHLPDSLEHIGEYAFGACKELKEVYIPENVKKIEGAPFAGCNSLTRITVSAENRWYDSRRDCNAIIQTDINRLIAGCKNTVIPDEIESVQAHAYENWINRESIVPPIVNEETADGYEGNRDIFRPDFMD